MFDRVREFVSKHFGGATKVEVVKPLNAEGSLALGRDVALFEHKRTGDYFSIRDRVFKMIDDETFDLTAFQNGSREIRGREHDLGETDMFQIGQRKLQNMMSGGRLRMERAPS